MQERRPYPRAIANAPQLGAEDQFYYTAFDDLATCRHYETGPIPVTAIFEYARVYGYGDDELDDLKYIIVRVDGWHLTRLHEKLKQQNKPGRRGKAKNG